MTGNGTLDKIIMALTSLICLSAAGVFYYTESLYQRKLPNEEKQKALLAQEAKEALEVPSYKLDKIIVNLPQKRQRLRFLDVTLYLRPFKGSQLQYFENNQAMIRDIVIDVASRMAPEEINTVAGKILLENRIKKKINKALGVEAVKGIYYSRFVVQ